MINPQRTTCEWCGKEFMGKVHTLSAGPSRYCSKECQSRAASQKSMRQCAFCGKEFYLSPSKAKEARRRCCSRRCAGLIKKKPVNIDGYVQLCVRDLPEDAKTLARATTKQWVILEHRLVMALHLRRPILPSESVHHINGIKTDNRIENLQIVADGEHHKEHAKVYAELRALRRENELLRTWIVAYQITTKRTQAKLLDGPRMNQRGEITG